LAGKKNLKKKPFLAGKILKKENILLAGKRLCLRNLSASHRCVDQKPVAKKLRHKTQSLCKKMADIISLIL
jgi:hypothetical protein